MTPSCDHCAQVHHWQVRLHDKLEGSSLAQAFQNVLGPPAYFCMNMCSQPCPVLEGCTHTHLYAKKLLHRSFYTEKSFTQMGFTQSLATDQLCAVTKSHFATVFDVRPSFRAKSLHLNLQNSNFTFYTNFGIRPSFGAKGGLHSTPDKIQHFTTRLCADTHHLRKRLRFVSKHLAAPAAKRENLEELEK